ncbi:unnamed protein product, partial [Tuber aestivum]
PGKHFPNLPIQTDSTERMDSSKAFLDFIFSDSPKDFKAAYASLYSKPYQIFDILLREERFTNFFSRTGVYGKNLANLLSQFPTSQKDDYRQSLLRENIKAFTLSLLAERFDDLESRGAAARIVISVVKLSDPGTLRQFGTRLGGLPEILGVIIAEGHIKSLDKTHKHRIEDLVSEPQARKQWAKVISELCSGCEVHGLGHRVASSVELASFIRTIPCGSCPSSSGLGRDTEGEPTRRRDHSFGSNMRANVFRSLLGDPLGPWKIILSQQAMENLGEAKTQGNFEKIRRKFSELASGDWAGKKILHRAKWNNSLSYRIPLFKAFYTTGAFILWQIDTAFDERFGEDYQVIKVWAVGNPHNLGPIGVQIHRAQQVYTKTRVEACGRDDLDGSREVRYPVRVGLDGEESGGMDVDVAVVDSDDLPQLAKFYSLTTTVLDNIASTTGKAAYPVDISREEASVVDHGLSPAFILGRSGTGKTTCLVYKLAGRYLLYSAESEARLRQVLLTRSKRLAGKLRVNAGGLIEAKLGERPRLADGNYDKKDDFDDNTKKQFLSLTDEDFPLVCTFDYLLRLIENSIRVQEKGRGYVKLDNSKSIRVIDFK